MWSPFERRSRDGWIIQGVLWVLLVLVLWLCGVPGAWRWSIAVGWGLGSVFRRPVLLTAACLLGGVRLGLWLPLGWLLFLAGLYGLIVVEWISHDGRVDGRWGCETISYVWPRYAWLGPIRWRAEWRERADE